MLSAHKDLDRKIEEMERKYNNRFQIVFETLDQLINVKDKKKKKIGFTVKEKQGEYGKKANTPYS
jgi:endo-alpha-1,4-polygalactosaminidase (GH114 family)